MIPTKDLPNYRRVSVYGLDLLKLLKATEFFELLVLGPYSHRELYHLLVYINEARFFQFLPPSGSNV